MSVVKGHPMKSKVQTLINKVTSSLPRGGEARPGQIEMADLVTEAVSARKPLLVEAGTGTGKSFAYLTPVIAADGPAVVATATIALQSQLVETDIPTVAKGLGRDVKVALLKGRSNYLCLQRLAELEQAKSAEQLELLGGTVPEDLPALVTWAGSTTTGDKEEIDPAPRFDAWAALSVGADECPGAARCPSGESCFAEAARRRATEADVVVTNHHYYGLNLAAGGTLLPEHEMVVFDEAHQLPDILGATCGTEISGNRVRAMATRARSLLTDDQIPVALDKAALNLEEHLRPSLGATIEIKADLLDVVLTVRQRSDAALQSLRKVNPPEGSTIASRVERAMQITTRLIDDCDQIIGAAATDVVWVDGSDANPILKRTPLELGAMLDETLWPDRAVILTSATLADGVVAQLGLPPTETVRRVDSPFDYPNLGFLYCPTDLPKPNEATHRKAAQDEMIGLIRAAGGRALCLFTSYAAMEEAGERLRKQLDVPVLLQGDGSKQKLVERFKADPSTVLAATMSFWQGIDLPGQTLTVVTIDRIPFPRPNEPVTQAKRDRAGAMAFREVDLPRAQTLLAQAAGRLVRTGTDRGVVAVLDPRLATSKAYRWDLINALPPFARTKDREQVYAYLRSIVAGDQSADSEPATAV